MEIIMTIMLTIIMAIIIFMLVNPIVKLINNHKLYNLNKQSINKCSNTQHQSIKYNNHPNLYPLI